MFWHVCENNFSILLKKKFQAWCRNINLQYPRSSWPDFFLKAFGGNNNFFFLWFWPQSYLHQPMYHPQQYPGYPAIGALPMPHQEFMHQLPSMDPQFMPQQQLPLMDSRIQRHIQCSMHNVCNNWQEGNLVIRSERPVHSPTLLDRNWGGYRKMNEVVKACFCRA